MKNKGIVTGVLAIATAIVFGFMFTDKLVENQRALVNNLSYYEPSVAGSSTSVIRHSPKTSQPTERDTQVRDGTPSKKQPNSRK